MHSRCKVGNAIRITCGNHKGETGVVIRIKKNRCLSFSDQLRHAAWTSLRFVEVVVQGVVLQEEVPFFHPVVDQLLETVIVGYWRSFESSNLVTW
jgi:ribosomal protein L24